MPTAPDKPRIPVRYPCQIVVRVSRETYDAVAAMTDRADFLRHAIDRAIAKAAKDSKKGRKA